MIRIHFWQMFVARITALFIGIAIGSYWHELVGSYRLTLVAIGVIGSLYVLYSVAAM